MGLIERHYTEQKGFSADYHRVKQFLKRIYMPDRPYGNWQWNRWEWAHRGDNTNKSRSK